MLKSYCSHIAMGDTQKFVNEQLFQIQKLNQKYLLYPWDFKKTF